MSSFRLRPEFTHTLDMGVDDARRRIEEAVAADGGHCELMSFPGFMCLRIPREERHYWSPRLNLSLEQGEDGGTRIHGIYGPNANLWSSLLYLYLVVGSIGLFSGILGACQWKLGMSPWGAWISGVMAAIAIGLYLGAQLGQKLGARQMFHLHGICERALGRVVEIH
jgi:hypothetical protein